MTMALFSLAKPVFGLVVGAVFVSMPVAHEKVIHAHELNLQQMEALEALEQEAAREAPENVDPEEAPATEVVQEGPDVEAEPAPVE